VVRAGLGGLGLAIRGLRSGARGSLRRTIGMGDDAAKAIADKGGDLNRLQKWRRGLYQKGVADRKYYDEAHDLLKGFQEVGGKKVYGDASSRLGRGVFNAGSWLGAASRPYFFAKPTGAQVNQATGAIARNVPKGTAGFSAANRGSYPAGLLLGGSSLPGIGTIMGMRRGQQNVEDMAAAMYADAMKDPWKRMQMSAGLLFGPGMADRFLPVDMLRKVKAYRQHQMG